MVNRVYFSIVFKEFGHFQSSIYNVLFYFIQPFLFFPVFEIQNEISVFSFFPKNHYFFQLKLQFLSILFWSTFWSHYCYTIFIRVNCFISCLSERRLGANFSMVSQEEKLISGAFTAMGLVEAIISRN